MHRSIEHKEEVLSDDIAPIWHVKSSKYPAHWNERTIKVLSADTILGRTRDTKSLEMINPLNANPNVIKTITTDKGFCIDVALPNKQIAVVCHTSVKFFSCDANPILLCNLSLPHPELPSNFSLSNPTQSLSLLDRAAKLSSDKKYLLILIHGKHNPSHEAKENLEPHTYVFIIDIEKRMMAAQQMFSGLITDMAMIGPDLIAMTFYRKFGLQTYQINPEKNDLTFQDTLFKKEYILKINTTPDFISWVIECRDFNEESLYEYDSESDDEDEAKLKIITQTHTQDGTTEFSISDIGLIEQDMMPIISPYSVVYLSDGDVFECNFSSKEKTKLSLNLRFGRLSMIPCPADSDSSVCVPTENWEFDRRCNLDFYQLRSFIERESTLEMRQPYKTEVLKGIGENPRLPYPLADLIIQYAWSSRWGLQARGQSPEELKAAEKGISQQHLI